MNGELPTGTPSESRVRPNARWKQRAQGGVMAMIGFLLSPLSWWNDLFVNIPLALGLAWLVSLAWPPAFSVSFVVGYWATNVLGLVLLSRGAKAAATGQASHYRGKELLKDLVVALIYTALIVVLIKLKVLQPVQAYFHQRGP